MHLLEYISSNPQGKPKSTRFPVLQKGTTLGVKYSLKSLLLEVDSWGLSLALHPADSGVVPLSRFFNWLERPASPLPATVPSCRAQQGSLGQ